MADKTRDNYKTIGHYVRIITNPGIVYMGFLKDINSELARLLPSMVLEPLYNGDQYSFRWEEKVPTEIHFDKIVGIQPIRKKTIDQFIADSKKSLEERVNSKQKEKK